MTTQETKFRLTNRAKAKPRVRSMVEVANQLIGLSNWTSEDWDKAERLRWKLEEKLDDECDALAKQLELQLKEWGKINGSPDPHTTEQLAKLFNRDAPQAPQQAARRQPKPKTVPKPVEVVAPVVVEAKPIAEKGKGRGRPTKYDHIDWVSIAARSQAGEGRRPLAKELGCPPTVVWAQVRKILGTA